MSCKDYQSVMLDLLLDPASHAAERAHMESCAACRDEFRSLEETFALMDAWKTPEPSPYFDQKLAVRLREEQAAAPAGWFERMKSRLLFNTDRHLRPALVGGLALAIMIGGGTFASLNFHPQKETSATVQDLQILDKNDQALQTMDQLLQDDQPVDDGSGSS